MSLYHSHYILFIENVSRDFIRLEIRISLDTEDKSDELFAMAISYMGECLKVHV